MFILRAVALGFIGELAGSLITLPSGLKLEGLSLPVRNSSPSSHGGTSKQVDQYLGIPFADPPVGDLRFRPPQKSSTTWNGVRKFTTYAPGCFTGKEKTSEDCLYLNVFRPSGPSDRQLPVMVWIHGGGYTSGRTDAFDGSHLAVSRDVIVVVPAYRLGAFGFFASRATLAESGSTGNWGFLDQQESLRWVRDNIRAFNGDASKVTLFGESAGAFAISAHLVSPASRGLFSAAILSSPTASSAQFYQNMTDSIQFSDWVASTLGRCTNSDDLTCLRRIPAARLTLPNGYRDESPPPWASRLFPYMPWGLTIDNAVLSDTPLRMIQAGHSVDVPVTLGVTQDEGSAFLLVLSLMVRPAFTGDVKAESVEAIVQHLVGDESVVKEVMSGYSRYVEAERRAKTAKEGVVDEKAKEAGKGGAGEMKKVVNATADAGLKQKAIDFIREIDIAQIPAEFIASMLPKLQGLFPALSASGTIPVWDKVPALFLTDSIRNCLFACPSIALADALSARNKSPVFFYNFAIDVWADTPWSSVPTSALMPAGAGTNLSLAELGAYHGSEIPFIFHAFPELPVTPGDVGYSPTTYVAFTGPQFCEESSFKRTVSAKFQCLWTNMARCGAPQCVGESDRCVDGLHWAPWGKGGTRKILDIRGRGQWVMTQVEEGIEGKVGAALPRRGECAKWDRLVVPFHNFTGMLVGNESAASLVGVHASVSKGVVVDGRSGGTWWWAVVVMVVCIAVDKLLV